jgi:hypothetical protein
VIGLCSEAALPEPYLIIRKRTIALLYICKDDASKSETIATARRTGGISGGGAYIRAELQAKILADAAIGRLTKHKR